MLAITPRNRLFFISVIFSVLGFMPKAYAESKPLKGKIVVVAGTRGAIGRAVFEAFTKEGATPVAIDTAMLQLEIPSSTDESACIRLALPCAGICQVPNGHQLLIDWVIAKYGRIDLLVNSAEYHRQSPPVEWVLESLCNYKAAMLYALPYLEKTKGSIVNVFPAGYRTAMPDRSASLDKYTQSELGYHFQLLVKSMIEEGDKRGVGVNFLIPGEAASPTYHLIVANDVAIAIITAATSAVRENIKYARHSPSIIVVQEAKVAGIAIVPPRSKL
jgi:NAD(P)-dependent dehydrogenase (short-subunit alcohol dehydrogenase family)